MTTEKSRPLDRLLALVVGLYTFLIFSPCLRNGFLFWDDQETFLLNFNYRGLGWSHLKWMLTAYHMGHYTPLAWVTLGLDYTLWGMNPMGYHLTNLLMHTTTAVLFYFLCLQLYRIIFPEAARENPRDVCLAACLSALLFSVHPLRVESVAWITERRDVLAAMFAMAALLSYIHRKYWPSLIFYGLSLFSKTSAIALPVVFLILDIYPLKRWGKEKIGLEKLPFVLLALPAARLALAAQTHVNTVFTFKEVGILERIEIAGYGSIFYLWKTLLPTHLSPLYDLPSYMFGPYSPFLVSTIVAIGLTCFFIGFRRKWPAALAVWTVYLLFLAPTSGLVQSGPQIAADRYSYLSCLGWPLLACSSFMIFRPKKAILYISILIVISISYLTFKQNLVWHDEKALWMHAVEADSRSPIANAYLGGAYMREGDLASANLYIQNALSIEPNSSETNYYMGCLLMREGRFDEAAASFETALKLNPYHVAAATDLGAVLLKLHRLPEAIQQLHKALELDPLNVEARINLGICYAMQNNLPEAITNFSEALQLDPDSQPARANLQHALTLLQHLSL